jgi:hypothetical protein
MENSPPGIQTIPAGSGAGAVAEFAIVGSNPALASSSETGEERTSGFCWVDEPPSYTDATTTAIADTTRQASSLIAGEPSREGPR